MLLGIIRTGNFHCSAVDTDVAVESDAMDIDKLSGFVREQFGPNLKVTFLFEIVFKFQIMCYYVTIRHTLMCLI